MVMSAAAALASGGAKVPLTWLVGVYVIQVTGGMCLSPLGTARRVRTGLRRANLDGTSPEKEPVHAE